MADARGLDRHQPSRKSWRAVGASIAFDVVAAQNSTVIAADLVGDLLFPVVVLITGAFLTGLLIPAWTRHRDEHRKALEVKTELVTDMSEAVWSS